MRDPEFFDDRDFFPKDDGEEIADARSRRRDVWQRLSQLMVACLFLLVLAGILRIFWPEIERHRELSAEAARLEGIRDKRLNHVAELERQNEWMLTDREYLESIARDRLDMAHSDEIVVRIDRDSEAKALQFKREQERQQRESLEARKAQPAPAPPSAEYPSASAPATSTATAPQETSRNPRATVVDLSTDQAREN